MTYEYFARDDVYSYDSLGSAYHFVLFPECPQQDTMLMTEVNHVDVYLCAAAEEWEKEIVPWNVWGAHYSFEARDYEEDPPYVMGEYQEFYANAISITDCRGKRVGSDMTDWPLMAALTAVHEFTHACWQSNECTYGTNYTETSLTFRYDYNELFANASTYLALPPRRTLQYDVRYAYSILSDPWGDVCVDPSTPDVKTWTQRYSLWSIFGAYLGHRFHRDDLIENSLLSRWSRNLTDRGSGLKLERTFCGLAELLKDADYDTLGFATGNRDLGGYRASRLFSDYGIARYVDSDVLDPAYSFGEYSPSRDAGQFRKIDANEYSDMALWELAIPPEFELDGANANTWDEYPKTEYVVDGDTVACCYIWPPEYAPSPYSEGWYDAANGHDNQYHWHGCVPIQLDLWGHNYLVFRADPTFYAGDVWSKLILEISWEDMHPDVELWVSALTYGTAEDSLFLRGNQLLDVDTKQYISGDSPAVVEIPKFKAGDNEAAVIVLALTDRECTVDTGCLRRYPYDVSGCPDLSYSYRFMVDYSASGCPFVSSLGSDGYVTDNNVLASTSVKGEDMFDVYVLEHPPDDLDGEYGLRLSEDESDYTRFDKIDLLAVDHKPGRAAAVLPDGTFGSYSVLSAPVACRDSEGNDLLKHVSAEDGLTAILAAGTWLDVYYPASALARGGGGGGGIIASGSPKNPVPPPGGGRARVEPGLLDATELSYRESLHTRILELPGELSFEDDLLRLRVISDNDLAVDQLFLAELSDEPPVVQKCPLLTASHSEAGDCLAELSIDNDVYASLAPGEKMDVSFGVPELSPDLERAFILVAEGQFEADRENEEESPPGPSEASRELAIYPNPFTSSTSVSFHVPAEAGPVSVCLYDAAGRLVRTLAREAMPSGPRVLTWDGKDDDGRRVATGVYFCRVEVPGHDARKKLVLLH